MDDYFSNETLYHHQKYRTQLIVTDNERIFFESLNLLALSGKINIFTTLVFVIIGLIGNSLALFIFAHSRFRINSSHIYLLCLAIIDSFFLVIHLFEDTAKTYKDIFLNETKSASNSIIEAINITDQFEFTCRLINYLRYVLRFISAYIVVAFTLQRLSIVYRPLSVRFKTKKSAWKTVVVIGCISLLMNGWVPFIFHIKFNNGVKYCDINTSYKEEYFLINMFYIFLIMLIPICSILVCNTLIIFKAFKNDSKRENLRMVTLKVNKKKADKKADFITVRHNLELGGSTTNIDKTSALKIKPHYLTVNQVINKIKKNPKNHSKKLLKTLTLISFSYALLNMPYLLTW